MVLSYNLGNKNDRNCALAFIFPLFPECTHWHQLNIAFFPPWRIASSLNLSHNEYTLTAALNSLLTDIWSQPWKSMNAKMNPLIEPPPIFRKQHLRTLECPVQLPTLWTVAFHCFLKAILKLLPIWSFILPVWTVWVSHIIHLYVCHHGLDTHGTCFYCVLEDGVVCSSLIKKCCSTLYYYIHGATHIVLLTDNLTSR